MNLIKSTGTFGFFTLLSRILGYLRDLLIAIYLGSGPLADAFFVAFRIPNTFRRLFSEGTFNAAFVPSYSAEITKGKKQSKKFANENGFVKTLMGGKCLVEDINSKNAATRSFMERAAINAPIQGSAADIIKRAMIILSNNKKLIELDTKMLLQVHDELIFPGKIVPHLMTNIISKVNTIKIYHF